MVHGANRIRAAVAAATALTLLTLGVPAPAAAVDPLISQGDTAAASSQESGTYTPSKAFDGNTTTTRWASALDSGCDCGSDNEWLRVDLGGSHDVSRVVLRWETAYGTGYKLQTSADASSWTDVHTTTTGDGGVDDVNVSGTGRYVRMLGTARATQWGYSLWEMEVYGVVTPGTGPAASTGGTWTELFADDFTGSSLDTSKWRPNWLGGSDTAVTPGANSAETACIHPDNTTVSGGALHLALTATSTSCGGGTKANRGAMVQSYSDGHTFGPEDAGTCDGECYFEARMKLPATSTYIKNWPAFWTNGTTTWPQGGENDIMEVLCDACSGSDGEVVATVHYWDASSWQEEPSNPADFRDNDWHTYGSQWSDDGTIRWYYDGTLIGTATGAESWNNHYVILNNTAGTWGGPTSTPATVDVDYVKVWGR